jgi:hypothetical protein
MEKKMSGVSMYNVDHLPPARSLMSPEHIGAESRAEIHQAIRLHHPERRERNVASSSEIDHRGVETVVTYSQ